VREAEQVLGHGRKETLSDEQELREFGRRSIFAIRDIDAGELLSHDNVSVLRCGKLGFGLPPDALDGVIGRTTRRPIRAETLIALGDLR